jgi:hypothetical protein
LRPSATVGTIVLGGVACSGHDIASICRSTSRHCWGGSGCNRE